LDRLGILEIRLDIEGHVLSFNQTCERLTGYAPDERAKQYFWNVFFAPADVEFARTSFLERCRSNTGKCAGSWLSKSGARKQVRWTYVVPSDQVVLVLGSEKPEDQSCLEDRLDLQAALLNQTHDAIMIRDLEDRIVFWNEGAVRMYGWRTEEAVGQDLWSLLYSKNIRPFGRGGCAATESGADLSEIRQVTKDRREIIVESRRKLVRDDAGEPRFELIANRDITEKKMLEMHALRAHRMESVETLAGGIVHDLNHSFALMLLATRMLRTLQLSSSAEPWLEMLQLNAEYAGHVASQLFAKGIDSDLVSIPLASLIHDTVSVVRSAFSIKTEVVVSPDLWTVSGNPTHLHEVLMNLCINAGQAMPGGGQLTIEAANLDVHADGICDEIKMKPGKYVSIQVSDTGCGIPDEIRDKIFDPFFTTKPETNGTGMGLFMVAKIVESYHGYIDITSKVGKGTRFRVLLPSERT
jgi:two-component system cell cycle sensor histidine kinase/response regulator CckA